MIVSMPQAILQHSLERGSSSSSKGVTHMMERCWG
jgi:hypothetical protein